MQPAAAAHQYVHDFNYHALDLHAGRFPTLLDPASGLPGYLVRVSPDTTTLISYLGGLGVVASTAQSLGDQFNHDEQTITTSLTSGPDTIFVGTDQASTFFVCAGTVNTNTNTHTEHFIDQLFQTTQTLSLSNSVLNQLDGDLYTTFQTVILDGEFTFLDILLGRSGSGGGFAPFGGASGFAPEASANVATPMIDGALAYAAAPTTREMGNGWRGWIKGSLGSASFEGTSDNFGFKDRTRAAAMGVELARNEWLLGAGAGFGHASVTQDTTNDFGGIDTVRAGAYASWRPGDWSVTAAVAAGFHSIDTTRLVVLPTPASASYKATSLSAGIEARRRVQLGFATVEPLAGLTYVHLHTDAFNETGTTFLDLAGNAADIASLKGYVGARLYHTISAPGGGVEITPELRARVLGELLDERPALTTHFVADPAAVPIAVTGIQPDRVEETVGCGIALRISPMLMAQAHYDADIRGSDLAHLVSGGLRVAW